MTLTSSTARPADLSAWLKDRFIPSWAERACAPGLLGYIEEFDADGATLPPPIVHTTMVTGRLVYTFSMAYRFDKTPRTLYAAEHGLAFLLDRCRLGPGRFAHRLGSNGTVIDADADLYDLAFVLLALGGYSAASGRMDVLAVAHEIADRLDREWIDPLGGYREPAGTGADCLQYPQMHLFEAFQMLAAVDPAGGWLTRAERIVDLVVRLVDPQGAIDEVFDSGWGAVEPKRRRRETGHHFEWAWLLFVYATRTGSARALDLAWRLFDFGLKAAGITASGLHETIPNSIDVRGRPTSPSRPFWATIELAKAALAATAAGGKAEHRELSESAIDMVLSQIDHQSATWANEQYSEAPDRRSSIPIRTLYHLIPCLVFFATYASDTNFVAHPNIVRPF